MTEHRTTCNRDCPDACSILATVEDGRVVQLRGDPDHPITQGFLCYRTSHFLERQYADDRITTPLVRDGRGFRAISWDQALDLVADKLLRAREDFGPASIFHYQSGGSLGALKSLCKRFWRAFGPVTEKRGDICTGALDWAQKQDFGATEANDLADLENARSILIWGKNVYTSNSHALPYLKAAKKRGARIVLVDPIRHKTAKLCERVIAPRPGGDLALALAVGQLCFERGLVAHDLPSFADNAREYRALCESRSVDEWLEEADVSREDADFIVDTYAHAPCTTLIGWGMGRRVNGAQIVRAVDALSVVTGNIGRPGAGASYYWNRKGAFDFGDIKGSARPVRTLCEPILGQELMAAKDPPVRVMWVTAGNPVAMLPNSVQVRDAIRALDFVVVVDSWMSDTAREADLILPVATLLEDDDLLGAYGHHYLGVSKPVVEPLGEAKTDLEILRALAPRVGLDGLLDGDARSWKKRALREGVSLDEIEAGGYRSPLAPRVVYEGRRFATENGRAQLLHEIAPSGNETRGMFLIAVSTPSAQSSQQAVPLEGLAAARVHPRAAGGARHGAIAQLVSAVGTMSVRVVYDDTLREDVCWMDKGGDLGGGRAANQLLRARLTDFGEGGALYDERVWIEP